MWLADFRVVLPDTFVPRGSVRIEDGRVAEIVDGPVSGAMISGDGLLLLPGFVDMHGDMVEWEVELRPNVRMPMELGLRDLDRRLAASGVTTAYAAVSFHPGSAYGHIRHFDNTSAIIRALKSMGDVLKVDHRVHARFEYTFPDALRVIEGLIAEGAVQLVSLSDHTPGQGQYRDIKAHIVRVTREKDLNRDKAQAEIARRIAEKKSPPGDMAATLRAISATCRAHGVTLASHDDDTAEKVALMQTLSTGISEVPVTFEVATGLPLSSGPVSV